MTSSAYGEQGALRGYRWQYDQAAALVYDALIDDEFESLHLVDPEAGQVDDLVLFRTNRVDAYQFKNRLHRGFLTFRELLAPQGAASGSSLASALADGWSRLIASYTSGVTVHLATNLLPSLNDTLPGSIEGDRKHMAEFVHSVLEPLRSGAIQPDGVDSSWEPSLNELRAATELSESEFWAFLRALRLDFGQVDPRLTSDATRRLDLGRLAAVLMREAGEAVGRVSLDRSQLLSLLGWAERRSLRSRHEFPVDLVQYEPLSEAVSELVNLLRHTSQGYIGLIGPPGSGKSTLLSQAISGSGHRIVRYYAFIPEAGAAATRLTRDGFLHDVVLQLDRHGLKAPGRHLLQTDLVGLREAFAGQLEDAGIEYSQTGRRTLIIVDGLDHVEREASNLESLLQELPRPDAIADGVVFLVGTRTLSSLGAHARQQVEEGSRVIDLAQHRLPNESMIRICDKPETIAHLDSSIHMKIAELSNGHPLAFRYLLNRLEGATDTQAANAVLDSAIPYSGDIAGEYRAIWEALRSDEQVVSLLALCGRLRISFTWDEMANWTSDRAVAEMRDRMGYLFRQHPDGWRVFHDSFRQFLVERTAWDGATQSERLEQAHQQRLAQLCHSSDQERYQWEELYHRRMAGDADAVLALGTQEAFRKQLNSYRSPDDVRSDLAEVMRAAADGMNGLRLISTLLSFAELGARISTIEDFDLLRALIDAGLKERAVTYLGDLFSRNVPLAQAYGFAARLHREGDPVGRMLFDSVEHLGFTDSNRPSRAGAEDATAQAWGAAVPLFRSVPPVMENLERTLENPIDAEEDSSNRREEWRQREHFSQVVSGVMAMIGSIVEQGLSEALDAIDAFAERQIRLRQHSGGDRSEGEIAALVEIRVEVTRARMSAQTEAEHAQSLAASALTVIRDLPHYYATRLGLAELVFDYLDDPEIRRLLEDAPYQDQLTVGGLTSDRDDELIREHIRYWTLRARLLVREGHPDVRAELAHTAVPPNADTPAGNEIDPSAPAHRDHEAIALAARLDRLVREVAVLLALNLENGQVPPFELRQISFEVLSLSDAVESQPRNVSLSSVGSRRWSLFDSLADLAIAVRENTPSELSESIGRQFEGHPRAWPIMRRVELGLRLARAGVDVSWLEENLEAAEQEAMTELDTWGRLEQLTKLVSYHAAINNIADARRIALLLLPASFGVGYRKDHQFDSWVKWLRKASSEGYEGTIQDGVDFARLLVAVTPMTEGAPANAAEKLPLALIGDAPSLAVAMFEFFVRNGTVDHLDALAELVEAFADGTTDANTCFVLGALVSDLLAPGSTRAHTGAGESVREAMGRTLSRQAADSALDALRARIARNALGSTRDAWARSLGGPVAGAAQQSDPHEGPSDEYKSLKLEDGSEFTDAEAHALIRDHQALIDLRMREAEGSTFDWTYAVASLRPSLAEVEAMVDAFNGERRGDAGVLLAIAERCEELEATDQALELSRTAARLAQPNSWSREWGGVRLHAHRMAVRLGDESDGRAAFQDVTAYIIESRWVAPLLLHNIEDLVSVLQPSVRAEELWIEIRTYLSGMAETLRLTPENPLVSQPARWWLPGESAASTNRLTGRLSAEEAISQMVVDHIGHPTWLLSHAATAIAARQLINGDVKVADSINRLASQGLEDDMLEGLARCANIAYGAGVGGQVKSALQPLDDLLQSHKNQILRVLAIGDQHESRQLPNSYRIAAPPLSDVRLIGHQDSHLSLYRPLIRLLAAESGLDADAVERQTEMYATRVGRSMPSMETLRPALQAAELRLNYPSPSVLVERAAFGRVYRDLTAAGLLARAGPVVLRCLRVFDPVLAVTDSYDRPSLIPPPPEAGHDVDLGTWESDLPGRLSQYESVGIGTEGSLVAAVGRLTVLNWDHLEEEHVVTSVVGRVDHPWDEPFLNASCLRVSDLASEVRSVGAPAQGEPIALRNSAWGFHQLDHDWIGLRPEIAAFLGWTLDRDSYTTWKNAAGRIVIRTVRWVDGWWGHGGPAFDDTQAEGWALIATNEGLSEISSMIGTLSRMVFIRRWGRESGGGQTDHVEGVGAPAVL